MFLKLRLFTFYVSIVPYVTLMFFWGTIVQSYALKWIGIIFFSFLKYFLILDLEEKTSISIIQYFLFILLVFTVYVACHSCFVLSLSKYTYDTTIVVLVLIPKQSCGLAVLSGCYTWLLHNLVWYLACGMRLDSDLTRVLGKSSVHLGYGIVMTLCSFLSEKQQGSGLVMNWMRVYKVTVEILKVVDLFPK